MNDSSSSRLAAALRSWIARAAPGARLPSTRTLTAQHEVSPVTVQAALRALVAEGLIETRPGAGTFVRAVRSARAHDFSWQTAALGASVSPMLAVSSTMAQAPSDHYALHAGYPDRELLPERLVRAALARAARSDAAVSRAPVTGSPELQAWFAAELASDTPSNLTAATARDVLITPGSQIALGSILRSAVGRGGVALVESPTYWGAISAAAQVGVRLVPVPSSADGPDLAALERAFAETGARVLYAQPNFANPTGLSWTRSHADRVLGIVREHGAFLVEDDWAHEFGIAAQSEPLAAYDDGGHVVYLRSLTKSVSPAIRVAAVIARGPLRDRLLADLQAQTMYVSGVLQAAALEVVTSPGWSSHLRGLRRQLGARRDLLVDAVREYLPGAEIVAIPAGGLNLWLRMADDLDLHAFNRACESRVVSIAIGDEWFPAEAPGRFVRLNFAGPNPGALPAAVGLMAEALDVVSAR